MISVTEGEYPEWPVVNTLCGAGAVSPSRMGGETFSERSPVR